MFGIRLSKKKLHAGSEDAIFLSPWLIGSFFVGMCAIFIILYPAKELYHLLIKIKVGQPITLFYLSQYEIIYPNDTSIHIARAKQAILLGKDAIATQEIQWLKNNGNNPADVNLLQFELEYYQAFRLPKGVARNQLISQLQNKMPELLLLPMDNEQLFNLAGMALAIKQPAAALGLYKRMTNLNDPVLLRVIGSTALQTSQYKISAFYYLEAARYDKYLDEKRQDIISALKVYESGGLFSEGIQVIISLPNNIVENKEFLIFLTQFALAANRPDLAQKFAREALMLRGVVK